MVTIGSIFAATQIDPSYSVHGENGEPTSNSLVQRESAAVPPPNGMRIGSSDFARLTVVTSVETRRQTTPRPHSVCSNSCYALFSIVQSSTQANTVESYA